MIIKSLSISISVVLSGELGEFYWETLTVLYLILFALSFCAEIPKLVQTLNYYTLTAGIHYN